MKHFYYIDTGEIPGFFLFPKNHIFIARSEDTIFIFHVWGFGVAMVTNMISQLHEIKKVKKVAFYVGISSVSI